MFFCLQGGTACEVLDLDTASLTINSTVVEQQQRDLRTNADDGVTHDISGKMEREVLEASTQDERLRANRDSFIGC